MLDRCRKRSIWELVPNHRKAQTTPPYGHGIICAWAVLAFQKSLCSPLSW